MPRGGKRDNAGPPKVLPDGVIDSRVQILPQDVTLLREIGGGYLSLGIMRACNDWRKHHGQPYIAERERP